MAPDLALATARRRLARAEHRTAVLLEELSWFGVVANGGQAWVDTDHTIDLCARAREARADLDDVWRAL